MAARKRVRKQRTARQKAASRKNLEKARKSRHHYSKSTESAEYLRARGFGKSKSEARKIAVKKARAVGRKLKIKRKK